jgi:predicted dehydrogenase
MSLHPAPRDERPTIGFGLLGYGFMGRAHSHSLHSIGHMYWPSAARPQLVAIAGRTQAGVAEAATRYGYASYSTDWRDLVSDPAVDVFDNVTTDAAHVEPTLHAIAAGKHVICEKPLAASAADCARLYEAAAGAGVKHLVCFNYRFFPAVRLAWELVHGGELGQLYQARFRYSQEWRTAPGPLPSAAGVQAIIACHAVDQARFLCGEITSVQASISSPVTTPDRLYRGGPVDQDDVVAMVARFDSGLVATIDASLVSPGRRNHLAWELNGTLGSVAWSLEDPNILKVYRTNGGRTSGFTEVITCEADHPLVAPWWPSGHVLGWEHGHANMLAHFIGAVAGDNQVGPWGATFFDGWRAAQVAEAVEESAETGDRAQVAPAPAPAG